MSCDRKSKLSFIYSETNVAVLVKVRDLLERLSSADEREGMHAKPLFKLYVKCLAFLSENLVLPRHLTTFKHGFIQMTFTRVSDAFLPMCFLSSHEFFNEKSELETQVVHKLKFISECRLYEAYMSCSTLVQIINSLCVMCDTEEKQEIGYEYYKFFLKSILVHGLDIERVLCLNCVCKFRRVASVRADLSADVELNAFLKGLGSMGLNETNIDMKQRLHVMLEKYFVFYDITVN